MALGDCGARAPRVALCLVITAGAGTAQAWVPVADHPVPRMFAAMAFDLGRGRTVLFGGMAEPPQNQMPTDTWEHDGRWHLITTAVAPPARLNPVLVHHVAQGRIVLFGGTNPQNVPLNDTWGYDGTNWQQVATSTAPPARASAACAYDLNRGRAVLFGGIGGAPLNDTWEFDGSTWTLVPSAGPAPRYETAMAFDAARGRSVLFGGRDANAWFGDTWEFDGSNWIQATPANAPFRRSGHLLVHDLARSRCVLAAGYANTLSYITFSDTWEYDGTNWSAVPTANRSPAGSGSAMAYDAARTRTVALTDGTLEYDGSDWHPLHPGKRYGHRLAFDSARDRTVLFGGNPLRGTGPVGDTWEHDGQEWRQAVTTPAPSARQDHAMVYDSRRQRTLLFGGVGGVTIFGDTWWFDGRTWQVAATPGPPPRFGHALAWDSARSRIVLFGGVDATGLGLADTWECDGATWSQMVPATAPPARGRHALAYDARLGNTVLYGGRNGGNFLSDTWCYDGMDWQLRSATGPRALESPALAYDPVRGRSVLTGGTDGITSRPEVYEFDGVQWTSAGTVPDRCDHAMVYDSARGRVLLYGGEWQILLSIPRFVALLDTLELPLPGQATWNQLGRGCPGSAGIPALDRVGSALPQLGTTFPIALSALPAQPGAAWLVLGLGIATFGGTPLPMDLGALGLPGCSLWIAPEAGAFLMHQGGSVSYGVAIPASPALSGLRLTAQALVFDATAPNGIGGVSNAGIGVVR